MNIMSQELAYPRNNIYIHIMSDKENKQRKYNKNDNNRRQTESKKKITTIHKGKQ